MFWNIVRAKQVRFHLERQVTGYYHFFVLQHTWGGVGWGGVQGQGEFEDYGSYFNGADKNKLQKYQSTTIQHCTVQ